jgi:hypothetical protein
MPRLLLAAALFAAFAAGQAHAIVRVEQVHPAVAAANATERSILFTGADRQAVDAFFRRYGSPSADGKGEPRRDPLLVRSRLPADADLRPLPFALNAKLPALPEGYQRLIVGRDLLLLERRTHTIVDIMREVVR